MIAVKKNGQGFVSFEAHKAAQTAFEPIFELRAYADGQYIPKPAIKRVRVYRKNGVGKARLIAII